MNIVFLDSYTTTSSDLELSKIDSLGSLTTYEYSTQEEGWLRGENADIIITNKYKVLAETLEHWKKVKLICVAATGYNNIDLEACKINGINVCNVSGYSTSSVVQQLFSSLLSVLNMPHHYFNEVRNGRWHQSRDFCFLDHSIRELQGMTMGVYGTGSIGSSVMNVALAYGMKVVAYSKYPDKVMAKVEVVSESDLFAKSDVLTIHAPLTEHTRNLVNTEILHTMKSDAILINTARGPIINENDLYNFLQGNPKFTAILDVLSVEPPNGGIELHKLPNCFITPHIAWASKAARQRLIDGLVQNIVSFQNGMVINRVV